MSRRVVVLRPREPARPAAIDAVSTEELLRLHERHFGRLDPKGRARLLRTARLAAPGGRSHGMDGLAA